MRDASPSPPLRRVLLVSTERRWRGGERQALLLASGLVARGVEVVFQAARASEVAGRLAESGAIVHGAAGRGARAAIGVRRIVAHRQPDVVHANDSGALVPAGLGALGRRIPVIAARRVAFPIRSPRLMRTLASRVVCVAPAVAAHCREAGIPAHRIDVVADGLALDAIDAGDAGAGRRVAGVEDDAPLVLCVGALTPSKGQAVLIRAVAALADELPAARLVLAGDGEHRGDLERLVAELGVDQRVRFLGFRDDVPDLLAAADVVASASLAEGLGSSTLEAMAAGRPVVATRVGGTAALLAPGPDGAVGWSVEPGSVQALATALRELLTRPEEAAERGRRAAVRARTHDADRMVTETLAAWARARQGSGRQRARRQRSS